MAKNLKDKYHEFTTTHVLRVKSMEKLGDPKPSILIVDDDAFNLYSLQQLILNYA